MSDLKDAEQIAIRIIESSSNSHVKVCSIVASLKKARIDGLKEGAKIAEGSYYDAIIVGKNKDHPTKWPNTPQEIATAIRKRIEELKP